MRKIRSENSQGRVLARVLAVELERVHGGNRVCATGKSAPEILEILRLRMQNDEATERHEAAEQQRQITQIRLNKWLSA